MSDRETGRTTRIIDKCIQELFTYGYCKVEDHYRSSITRSRDLQLLIAVRLRTEHNINHYDLKIAGKTLKLPRGYNVGALGLPHEYFRLRKLTFLERFKISWRFLFKK